MTVTTLTADDLSDIIQAAYIAGAKKVAQINSQQSTKPTTTELVTANQAAELLNVSSRTIKRWAKAGHLDTLSFNSTVRYRRSEVMALLDTKSPAKAVLE